MGKLTAVLFACALLVLSAGNAKALITLNIMGTCTSGDCAVGVDTMSGTMTYDFAGGTVPFFNLTTSKDNIVYDAATGGPITFEATSDDPPVGFSPESFTMTFAGAGLPASANPGDTFIIESVVELYGGEDVNIDNFYTGIATVVPVPAALPLFLSAFVVFGCLARRRHAT